MMEDYTDAEIVVHYISALVGNDIASWRIGLNLSTPIPKNDLHRVQELTYYPCDWDTASKAFKFLVNEFGMQPDLCRTAGA